MSKQGNETQSRHSIRQVFREKRKSLSFKEQKTAAHSLVTHCEEKSFFETAKNIALYKTNDGELDTQPLIEALWKKDINVFLPVLHPFADGHLLFLRYTPLSGLVANGFGILEPRLSCPDVCPIHLLDIMFMPLVAFDSSGNRLGMGGGFFDRTLSNLHMNKQTERPRLIGLAHDMQGCDELPTEAWDVPLPEIVTPTRYFNFNVQ